MVYLVSKMMNFFFSDSLNRRMALVDQKREQARFAANQRWKTKQLCGSNADALQTQCGSNAIKGNKIKVNESKLKEKDICATSAHTHKFTPPSLDEVKAYCTERHNHVDAEKWVDFYTSKNWMIGKNKMTDWKAAVRTWEKESRTGGNFDGGIRMEPLKNILGRTMEHSSSQDSRQKK